MDMAEYREKVRTLLSNKDTYAKITDKRRNPTSRVEKDLNKLLSEIKSCSSTHDQNVKQMDSKTHHRLHSTDATPASFYGLLQWAPKDPQAWYTTTPNNQLRQRTNLQCIPTFGFHLIPAAGGEILGN